MHNLNPTLLSFGPLEIRWYGIIYVLGFFLSIWWLHYMSKKGQINLDKEEIWDLAFWLMVGVLIGSRLFEVFWQPERYLSNPLNFFKFWEGGMSFHGGFVGIVIAGLIYSKKKKINFWKIADVMSVPTIFALALGRIANFLNGELIGKVFNGSWCVNFKNTGGGDVCRHPYVLYEAGKRFVITFGLLWLTLKRKFKPGFIFWNLVFFEGLGRFLLDFYKDDFIYYWIFTPGQWLSIAMVIVSLYFFHKNHAKDCKNLFKLE